MVSKSEIFMNIILHVFILFVILSLIFWFVISKVSKKAITREINRTISESFTKLRKNIQETSSKEDKTKLKKNMDILTPSLSIMKRIYSKPESILVTNNNWLYENNILYGIILFVIIATMLLSLKLTCGINNFPFIHILKENLVLFLFIAVIEVYFFLNIGMKFIPTKPSALIENISYYLKSAI